MKRAISCLTCMFVFTCLCSADTEKLNKAAGLPIFGQKSIWQESPKELKSRLKFPFEETQTTDGGVLSLYTKGKLFGANANEIKFEYKNDKISAFKIVFFNKGDSVRDGKWSSSDVAKMRADARAIFQTLSKEFGDPENSSIGKRSTRVRAKEWKYQDTKMLLGFEDKEFIIMHILPNSEDDESAVKEGEKARLDVSSNVNKSDVGDITIKVPMVNQGNKGYCFPATIERLFMYYQIKDVDMHKLADMFGTGAGGSTYLSAASGALSKLARANRLKFKMEGLDFSKISKYIDDGVPMVWLMFSTPDYNAKRRERTKERKDADFEEWQKICRKEKKFKLGRPPRDSGHICLIVGYNKETKELAISDSWGDASLTWITFDMAKAVSQSSPLLVLSPR